MGIPHLKEHLKPYAEHCVLNGDSVVIDGPAFAYHILHLCQASNRSKSPADQASYAVLGRAAIQWLDFVQSLGVVVSAIFFDGFLPPSKLPERLRRTVQATKNLTAYHATHITGVPPSHVSESDWSTIDLFPATLGSTSAKGRLPSPAFLAPAVIEALAACNRYARITRVVPGEADGYCANYVSQHGGIVLTEDSDLLLYNLGHTGSVVWLRDIELKERGPYRAHLFAPKFTPAAIGARLKLPDKDGFLKLGFHATIDTSASLKSMIATTRRSFWDLSIFDEEFEEFSQPYIEASLLRSGDAFTREPPSSPLDTRIAELIFQCEPDSSNLRDVPESPPEYRTVRAFLPLLLDDPCCYSAWDSSGHIRQLAYFVLQTFASQKPLAVREFRRMHTIPESQPLKTPRVSATSGDVAAFHDLMITISQGLKQSKQQWIVLAIYRDIAWSLEQEWPGATSIATLQRLATGHLDTQSWGFLHLVAQIQATMYSCRMLQQVFGFCSSLAEAGLPRPLLKLQQYLDVLPPLSEFPSCRDLGGIVIDLKDGGGLAWLLQVFGSNEDVVNQLTNVIELPKKKFKKLSVVDKQASQAVAKVRPSNNPFDLLTTIET